MEGRRFLPRKDREALRERWLLRAGKAFERMFAEANQDQLVTFTEREDMACLLGQELAAFLLGSGRKQLPDFCRLVIIVSRGRKIPDDQRRGSHGRLYTRRGTPDATALWLLG